MTPEQKVQYQNKQRQLRNHRLLAIWLVGLFLFLAGFREMMEFAPDFALVPWLLALLGLLLIGTNWSLAHELERQALARPAQVIEVLETHEVWTSAFGRGHVRLVPPVFDGEEPA